MKPKWRKRHVDLGQYVWEDASHRAAHAYRYGRKGVMPDYTALTGPDYEAAVRDNVWSDRNQEQRIENIMRAHATKERLRYRTVPSI